MMIIREADREEELLGLNQMVGHIYLGIKVENHHHKNVKRALWRWRFLQKFIIDD